MAKIHAEQKQEPHRDGLARVWVHTKKSPRAQWQSEGLRYFARVPTVGEHFTLASGSPWYEVTLVVHLPWQGADSEAEVYALEADDKRAMDSASRAGVKR